MSRGTLFRRNLTGSPAPKNAFDLWSQYQLLDPKIFDMKFTTFKATYGIWKRMKFGARSFDMLDVDQGERGFKNLDQLYEITKPYTSRLLRADVFENLPKNVPYQCRFDLSEKQEKAIQDLKNEMMTVLDSGEVITTQFAIVQIMRVQQIARGFVGQTGKEVIDLGGPYPALEALTEEMDKLLFDLRLNRKIIIWARFTADVDMIIKHLTKEGYGECVRYDGQVKPQQREENVHRFQTDPKVRVLVGNPAARTEGQDMTAGYGMIYYSYSYDLLEREQSTGRNHGVNQKEMSLPVIDMVANRTWDDIILENLAGKKDLGAIITGDKFRKMVEAL
jgi:SNF2 family DNA or RNA helicase